MTIVTYMGGKQRLSKQILDIITKDVDDKSLFVDLCCGSGAVALEALNQGFDRVTMIDSGIWGFVWENLKNANMNDIVNVVKSEPSDKDEVKGYLLDLSKGEFQSIENIIGTFLILQAGSFGGTPISFSEGKFHCGGFRSYWKPTATSNRRHPVNPMMPMPDTIVERLSKVLPLLSRINAKQEDAMLYLNSNPVGEIIYIDPPYESKTGYVDSIDYMKLSQELANRGNHVWVSESKPLSDEYYTFGKRKKGNVSGGGHSVQETLSHILRDLSDEIRQEN